MHQAAFFLYIFFKYKYIVVGVVNSVNCADLRCLTFGLIQGIISLLITWPFVFVCFCVSGGVD